MLTHKLIKDSNNNKEIHNLLIEMNMMIMIQTFYLIERRTLIHGMMKMILEETCLIKKYFRNM